MTQPHPRFLIIGAGAIGSFYGAILKRAGCTVEVVVRSDHALVAEQGFHFTSPLGELSWMPDRVYGPEDEAVPGADYVLLCTKVLSGEDRVALVRPWLGNNSTLVLIENGLDIERPLAQAFPENPLVSAIAFIGVSRTGPGQVAHSAYGHLVMGSYPAGSDPHCQQLAELFSLGGIQARVTDQVVAERWRKSVWNAPFNPLSVLADGADTASMLDAPGGEALVRAMMAEVLAVAAADGYPLPADLVDKNIASTRTMGAYKNSMALDYLNGRALEVDAILGNIVSIAERHGVAVPHLSTVLTTLRIRERVAI